MCRVPPLTPPSGSVKQFDPESARTSIPRTCRTSPGLSLGFIYRVCIAYGVGHIGFVRCVLGL